MNNIFKIKKDCPKFHYSNETHKQTIFKFVALLLILVVYFLYMSWKYEAETGLAVAVLTWSFFCTMYACCRRWVYFSFSYTAIV